MSAIPEQFVGDEGPGVAPDPARPTTQRPSPNALPWAVQALRIYADALADFEDTRIRTGNRIAALIRLGAGEDSPEVLRLRAVEGGLKDLEHQVELDLRRVLRHHPLHPWVKQTPAIGEKTIARLLGVIGTPHLRDVYDETGKVFLRQEPRTLSQLNAYCGYHVLPAGQRRSATQRPSAGGEPSGSTHHSSPDTHCSNIGAANSRDPGQSSSDTQIPPAGVAPTRRKGQRSNWNTQARTRVYLIAESCIKATGGVNKAGHNRPRSPYRDIYEAGRVKYADAVHAVPCTQCGPSGNPAQPGSPLKDSHKHMRAMRLVGKAILKDLWQESRRVAEVAS